MKPINYTVTITQLLIFLNLFFWLINGLIFSIKTLKNLLF